MNRDEQARLDELLMQRVTGSLSAPEADVLANLMKEAPASMMAEWDAAAAELTVQMVHDARTPADALPGALEDRIARVGEAFVRTQRGTKSSATPVVPIDSAPSSNRFALWGGWLAAAAILAVWVGSSRTTPVADVRPQLASTGALLRDSLLDRDSSLVRWAWTATADSSAVGATGDVVWSERAQRGVMRIAGLLPNGGRRWQYQLWIFDKSRDQRFPVDGGVFDIPDGTHEVFVPIDARVPVGQAVMFAVTVEPPGGVVVSTRERIALLAKPAG